MMDLKNISILIGFVLMLLSITMTGINKKINVDLFMDIKRNSSLGQLSDKSFFEEAHYYVKKKGDVPFYLNAKKIIMNPGKEEISFVKPRGAIFQLDSDKFFYEAERGYLDQKKKILFLKSKVKINSVDMELKSENFVYFFSKMKAELQGKVKTKIFSLKTGDKVFIDSQKFVFLGNKQETFIYSGKVRGRIKRKKVYEEGLSFNSKKLYFYKGKLKTHLEGKVLLKYKNFEAKAQSGDIFLENYNKSLKYFVLYDDVKVRERLILRGRKVVRKAFSERLEGFPGKSQVILTGYPKVLQEEDAIVGNKIILRWNNEVLEIIDANSNLKLKSNKHKK